MTFDEALKKEVEKVRHTGVVWGEVDCCLFVANVVRECTGIDHARMYRGQYTSVRGALRLLAANNGLENLIDALFHDHETTQLKKGNVVLYKDQDCDRLGLFDGRWVVGPSDDGVCFSPPDKIKKQWGVL